MRTTLNLDDDLLRDAKETAARTGRSLTAIIEEALRESLARRRARQTPAAAAVSLPTYDGGGLQAGIDLDDTASLLDLMESGA